MSGKKTVDSSAYLAGIKPQLKDLLGQLLNKYEYASVLAVDSEAKQYGVRASGISVGDAGLLCSRGFVVKVYNEGEYAEYSFNKLNENIDLQAEEIIKSVEALKKALPE
ncbi:MAG: hypothetical protein ACI4R6_05610, partial [Lachnospiraceae bacterium]